MTTYVDSEPICYECGERVTYMALLPDGDAHFFCKEHAQAYSFPVEIGDEFRGLTFEMAGADPDSPRAMKFAKLVNAATVEH